MPPALIPLCQRSNLIIQGQVASVLPARKLGLRSLETDVIVTVSSVLKGTSEAPQVVISPRGGTIGQFTEQPTQYDLMKPGERYILFLTDDDRKNIPAVPGIPRHWITGFWAGIFRVDGQTLHLPSGAPKMLRDKYDSADVQTAFKDITAAAAIP